MPNAPDSSLAAAYGERAIDMMHQLAVVPTPKHYSVFFACVAGQPTELVKEIQKLISAKKEFTDEVLDQLYNTHLAEAGGRAVQETAANARKILAEMVASVAAFTGTTQHVSQGMADQLKQLDGGEISEETLRQMASTVIDSAKAIKSSSDMVSEKLATAQAEVVNLRENLAKATTESEKDFLTGCYNRKAFDKHLFEAVREANEKGSELALLMLDIDHFKSFNDNYGHLVGDEVLKIVGKALTDSVKGMDVVARYGGEEFAVVLPRTPVGGGMIVAEGIRKMIASKELKRRSSGENYGAISVSIGVAAFRHQQDTPQSLTKRADEALYRSKNAGRNRVTQEDLSAR